MFYYFNWRHNRGFKYGAQPAVAWTASFVWLTISVTCLAQESRNQFNQLLLPTSREAQTLLQNNCQLWSSQVLRPTIDQLEKQYSLSIWLDRRIDSGQTVSLSRVEDSTTLGDELQRMVVGCGAAGGLVENVYLVAPTNRLARIQRSAVVLHGQLASARKSIANDSRAISWPDITSSNELIELIQRTWDIELVSAQQAQNQSLQKILPHDLLHQGQLPRCSLATQLALVLGGFDLQASLEASSKEASVGSSQAPLRLKVQPLSSETIWQDTYARLLTPAQLRELKQNFPQSTFEELPKNSTKLRGETNAHLAMLALGISSKRSNKKQNDTEAQTLLTFEMQAPIPVEAVLNNLAEKLQFELVWSEECTALHRNRLIKLKVDKATRQELLEEVGKAADLSLIDQKSKVVVSPK